MRPALVLISCGLLVGGGSLLFLGKSNAPDIEQKLVARTEKEAPAMCPWRDPKGDLARFFPGEKLWHQETLVLSPYRQEILTRLGPGETLDSNSLYVYRVGDIKPNGSILVKRFAGEFGAIEAVIAVNLERQIIGVRVQRHREPPENAKALENTSGFAGKSEGDALPQDSPALARAVRATLIALDVAESKKKQ